MTKQEAMERAKAALLGGPFPTLGDPNENWHLWFSEPEINAIHACVAFVRAACENWPTPLGKRYWGHYGPTLEALTKRLSESTEPPEGVNKKEAPSG